jgi:TAT (twin-arginine translocation) pathway signal sequence
MNDVSRRRFLHVSAGAAAAGAVLSIAGPRSVGGAAGQVADALDRSSSPASNGQPMVVHIRDARAGELSIMGEDSEVVVRDHALVRRIVSLAGDERV